jgi:hypothetical protein
MQAEFCDRSCLEAFAEKRRKEAGEEKRKAAGAAQQQAGGLPEEVEQWARRGTFVPMAGIDKEAKASRRKQEQHESKRFMKAKQARLEAVQARLYPRYSMLEAGHKKTQRSMLKAIQANPGEPMLYLQLADFLLSRAGKFGHVKEFEPRWRVSEIDTGRTRPRVDGNNRVISGMDMPITRKGKPELDLVYEWASIRIFTLSSELHEAIEDAANNYLKAISLGIPSPYGAASVKITYAKLLWLLGKSGTEYYAREAEKDLRRHLKSTPDHIAALEQMIEAVSLYEDSERIRGQRLSSIRARIEEAKTRKTLGITGRAQALPRDTENAYPENWSTLAESVRKRDNYRCSQCGAQSVELHVHHIVPLSKGGDNDLNNLTTLCDYCHGEIHPRMGK